MAWDIATCNIRIKWMKSIVLKCQITWDWTLLCSLTQIQKYRLQYKSFMLELSKNSYFYVCLDELLLKLILRKSDCYIQKNQMLIQTWIQKQNEVQYQVLDINKVHNFSLKMVFSMGAKWSHIYRIELFCWLKKCGHLPSK